MTKLCKLYNKNVTLKFRLWKCRNVVKYNISRYVFYRVWMEDIIMSSTGLFNSLTNRIFVFLFLKLSAFTSQVLFTQIIITRAHFFITSPPSICGVLSLRRTRARWHKNKSEVCAKNKANLFVFFPSCVYFHKDWA